MRTILVLLSTLVLIACDASQGDEVQGWQAAQWGMTPDDIHAVFPTAMSTTQVFQWDEARALLGLRGYKVDDCPYDVDFYFSERTNRLSAVRLYIVTERQHKHSFNLARNCYYEAYDRLRSQYGNVNTIKSKSNHFFDPDAVSQWETRRTVIRSFYTEHTEGRRYSSAHTLLHFFREPEATNPLGEMLSLSQSMVVNAARRLLQFSVRMVSAGDDHAWQNPGRELGTQ
jgi:hypothetical protein